jgi:hypothetical protein
LLCAGLEFGEVGLADVVLGVVVETNAVLVNIVVASSEVEDGNDPHCQLNAEVH